jgi:peptidyl-prolyl cis-trans isomerase SurA
MNFRIWAPVLGFFCTILMSGAQAQSAQSADYIVAVVNSEPITHSEVRNAVQRTAKEMQQQRVALPPADELQRLILERLINERAQLQFARESGIKVDTAAVDQAEQAVARQNQIEVAELHARLARDGIGLTQFRNQLRDQLTLTRLHERDVEGRLRVSESDIDRALAEQQAGNADPMAQQINLANLLVSVPENATTEQAAQQMLLAQKILNRIRAGEDFAALVQEYSAGDRTNGGQLGLRRADRYPPSFLTATRNLAPGGVSEIVRSGAGYHILKVVEKRAPEATVKATIQSRARHILLRTSAQLSQAAAVTRIAEFKRRIETGAATFQALALEFSQDGSAVQGGDLGWVGPGAFVPEFEEPMNRLSEGQISGPVVSRFGVHLIQLMERRRVELTEREIREGIRAQLRESRYETVYATWAQEIRANAFVEMRDPPQ